MGKQEFPKQKEVVHLPWRLHCEIVSRNDILASRRHTRGNSDTEVLKGFENPEKLFKRKNKEQIDFPLFGPSSSSDSHTDSEEGVSTVHTLLRTRSESDLSNPELNSHRRESHLFGSLWRDLQKTSEAETSAHVRSQNTSVPVNPPRPMAARFSPLRLPAVLHDLPQNYSQRISLFDGEGDVTAK